MHKSVSKIFSLLLVVVAASVILSLPVYARDELSVMVNGKTVYFDNEPIIEDGTTLVEVRPLAKALGANVKWSANTQSVKLTTSSVGIVLKMDYDIMTSIDFNSDDETMSQFQLSAVPCLIDDVAYVPLRVVAEALGAEVELNDDVIEISVNGYSYKHSDEDYSDEDYFDESGHTFYFQNQSDWQFPEFGSGYCWTCSYAMLISDVTGSVVTPVDVAAVNEAQCGNGAYCYHWDIVDEFGVKFVPALSKSSPYYGGTDSNSGGTKIDNESLDEDIAIEALKEALDNHPEGVMVRYASYPHTMVAVGYSGDTIYFNEPMRISTRAYMDSSHKSNVPFEETCVGQSGISIAEITFIQALAEN